MAKETLMGRVTKAVKTSLAKGAVAAVDMVEEVEKSVEARLSKKSPAAAKAMHERAVPAVSAAKKAALRAKASMMDDSSAPEPRKAEKTEGAPRSVPNRAPREQTSGRKTVAAAAPKRSKAPVAGPKVKRGQKHRHHR